MVPPATESKIGDGARGSSALAGALAGTLTWLLWLWYQAPSPGIDRLERTDLANYYYPLVDRVGRRLAEGELPLWNPAVCSGNPLLATLQPAVLYPPTWIATVLEPAGALFAQVSLHVVAAAVGFAWALRAGGTHPVAAALGGVFYAHACLFAHGLWPPHVATLAWLPFQWLCVEKLVAAWRWRWWTGLAATVAFQLLAGFPQYVVYGFYWLAPYALFRLVDARHAPGGIRRRVREGAWLVVAVALGFGIAGAQLAPTLELTRQSERQSGLTAEEIHYLDVGTRPVSRVLRNAVDPTPKNPTFALNTGTGYLGVGSLLAAALALFARRRETRTAFLLVGGLLFLLLSDGFHGGAAFLFRIYHELPTGDLFRTPERLRVVPLVCFAVLAAWGIDALLRVRPGGPRIAFLGIAGVVAVGVGIVGGPGSAPRAALALALCAGLVLAPSRPAVRVALATAWLLFAASDLWLATAKRGPLRAYPPEASERLRRPFGGAEIDGTSLAKVLLAQGQGRVELRYFVPTNPAGSGRDLRQTRCHEPLAPGQWRALETALGRKQVVGGVVGLHHPHFDDVASVNAVVRERKGRILVERNPDALPRAYRVHSARAATPEEAFAHIRDDSFDFRSGVLLDPTAIGSTPAPAAPSALRPATIRVDEPEHVAITLPEARRGTGQGWLVLTDTFYPGWVATVDGLETPIVRANGLYRAVRVPDGAREVVFRYAPESLVWGVGVSAASIALLAGIAWLGSRVPRALSGGAASVARPPSSPASP